jgi:DNA-directed RNA polymerase subunit E"
MRACRNCRFIVNDEKECPQCKGVDLSEKFSGQVIIVRPEQSEVAKLVNVTAKGMYAISVK